MKSVLAFVVATAMAGHFASIAHAQVPVQPDGPRLATYLEFMGNASAICCSANLDFLVTPRLSVRVGFGSDVLAADDNKSLLFMLNHLRGRNGHSFEIGAGVIRL
jgi:hypothetical protein